MNDLYEQETDMVDILLNEYHEKKLCGGSGSCASCRQEEEIADIKKRNEEFDRQLWTFTAVHNETGEESILYGHATYNVFIYALATADSENSWLKVTKCVKFKCDYSGCPGGHSSPHGYCSATQMYEDMMNDPRF